MTRERIEDMREVVLPFVKKRLLETNYEQEYIIWNSDNYCPNCGIKMVEPQKSEG